MMNNIVNNEMFLHLMQISSSFFPVGNFAYSHGLEWAIHSGWVNSISSFNFWQQQIIKEQLVFLDWPMLKRMYFCIQNNDENKLLFYIMQLLSFRETYELRLEERERGQAMVKLFYELSLKFDECWLLVCSNSFIASIALLGYTWKIPLKLLAMSYGYSFMEGLIAVGLKLVPFGQYTAQKFLMSFFCFFSDAWKTANLLQDSDLGSSFPLQAIASSCHEEQSIRLFRS